MSGQRPEGRLSVVTSSELVTSSSPNSPSFIQQDEVSSDCPLLTPSPPPHLAADDAPTFGVDSPAQLDRTLSNINSEDGLAFLNIVNSSCKAMHDEPSSRDPMLETSSEGGSSSDTNEPVCTQLLTQLNTAYTHLAPDAQALFYNQGEPPLTGIQLVVPKPPKNYSFMSWNWPVIRKTFFWTLMSIFAGCIALAIGVIATMPRKCEPPVQWWQGSLFYEIFPASFQDSYGNDGVGDLQGITNRLQYINSLGVQTIRLNSIFPTNDYPTDYDKEVQSLMKIDPRLGSLSDFDNMVSNIRSRNMKIILDLPLYPYVKNFGDHVEKRNLSDHQETITNTGPLPPYRETRDTLKTAPYEYPTRVEPVIVSSLDDHELTKAIRFWQHKGVDGFYLKGLEHFVNETNFMPALRHWKTIIGSERIFMCSEKALNNAVYTDARNAIMHRVDLIDVFLAVSNDTESIKSQVIKIIKGPLFEKSGYPWIHWSTGSVDSPRLASTLPVANASVAIAMLGMMLPGTPNIFYGDELGMLNSDKAVHLNRYQLAFMNWLHTINNDDKKPASKTWMPTSAEPAVPNLNSLIHEMAKLREETPSIYVKSVVKHNEAQANCDVRYTKDEVIVIERWYPRRNTFVFVANLGIKTQIKDLSALYYGGYIVVGPDYKLHQNIYFKELMISPGEAFIIKLDK
ncbi:neutral and basic amino acid transport protein rBAT-like [Phymastichus coffea]|uniref:neutral and basic amino acid transport protein rBAT-like n=1 Tax=Phymastichus coffea TaxID=108790 RepID=UPI00273B210A|nr:neutral and basic amino acid transport protein rBAT-like [Phymastichus coffea]XP_058809477.1 neutral and basic amino acid transport protein rBAT-like [Phymastichus coffea]